VRLAFFGTGSFALPAIKALADDLVLVVTQPDRPSGRSMKLQPTPAKILAESLGIPCTTPERARAKEFVDHLVGMKLDALVVASYGQILSQAVLDSAKWGGINLHGSILPAYRGAAPIQRCLLDGCTETGVTLMQMDRGMDTGDIIHIERLQIGHEETYGELQDRLADLAAEMAKAWMPRIVSGDYTRIPQDGSLATMAPKVSREESEIRFEEPAKVAVNRYQAFTPNPSVFARTSKGQLKLHKISYRDESAPVGQIIRTSPELQIGHGEGSVVWLEIQPEGKKRMSGRDFANGARLKPGDSLLP
jgi:methionyl-tRNA formyltransferase